MAIRHVLINRPPEDVWRVLSDGRRYAEWVVGTYRTEESKGTWPELDSAIVYTVKLGPLLLRNETRVRICEPPVRLELEAKAGPLGTARIAIEIRRWGQDASVVVLDEHPLSGPGARWHNVATEAFLQVRHRKLLDRLARVVSDG